MYSICNGNILLSIIKLSKFLINIKDKKNIFFAYFSIIQLKIMLTLLLTNIFWQNLERKLIFYFVHWMFFIMKIIVLHASILHRSWLMRLISSCLPYLNRLASTIGYSNIGMVRYWNLLFILIYWDYVFTMSWTFTFWVIRNIGVVFATWTQYALVIGDKIIFSKSPDLFVEYSSISFCRCSPASTSLIFV